MSVFENGILLPVGNYLDLSDTLYPLNIYLFIYLFEKEKTWQRGRRAGGKRINKRQCHIQSLKYLLSGIL